MTSTKVRDLLGLAIVAAIAAWLLIRSFYGSLPPIPVFAGASLYVVAAVEVVLAFVVRSRIDKRQVGDGPSQLHPITAARAVALAKASALVGAAAAGVWVGFLLHIVPLSSSVRAASSDRTGVIVGLVAALVLVGAALWLEHCCKTPTDSTDDPAH